ncbi:MAG TPA: hypothetical protein PKD86_06340 [Gemmatales bacterium]|nr:hypothetical protein [Gemmatales bacterium]HMP58955.1 hypothetical protein [Gemmatales bacterium]
MSATRVYQLLAIAGWTVVAILVLPRLWPEPPAPVPVQGRAHFSGRPLRGGTIVLSSDPDRDDRELLAQGEIRTDGSFSVRAEGLAGVRPGWYRVTLTGVDAAGRPTPTRYRHPEQSALLCHIQPGGPVILDFHLRP